MSSGLTILLADSRNGYRVSINRPRFYLFTLLLLSMTLTSIFMENIPSAKSYRTSHQQVISFNQQLRTKAYLLYRYCEKLNGRATTLAKHAELLTALTKNENSEYLLLNPEYAKVSIEEKVYGYRVISYSLKLGDRVLYEYISDKFKKERKNVSERVAYYRNNLETVVTNGWFTSPILVKRISDDEYQGYIKDLIVFMVNKDDALHYQIPCAELADKYASTLQRELKIAKENKLILETPLRGSISLIRENSSLAKTSRYISDNINFTKQLIGSNSTLLAKTNDEVLLIKSNYAKTPSMYPLRYQAITSPFGYRIHPLTNKVTLHEGMDLEAWPGTKIMSTADGIVQKVGWIGGYGLMVQVNHGLGISTIYGHCSQTLVKRGQRLKKGQTIALSGNTGLSDGPHLHYEIRRWNISIDPTPYLNRDILTAKKDW